MEENAVKTRQRHRSADEWRELVAAWKQRAKHARPGAANRAWARNP